MKESKKTLREKPEFCLVDFEEHLKYLDTEVDIKDIKAVVQGPF
jgi:hypothetical protein